MLILALDESDIQILKTYVSGRVLNTTDIAGTRTLLYRSEGHREGAEGHPEARRRQDGYQGVGYWTCTSKPMGHNSRQAAPGRAPIASCPLSNHYPCS